MAPPDAMNTATALVKTQQMVNEVTIKNAKQKKKE